MTADAWERGRRAAADAHIPPIGATDHVLAVSPGPPWIEPPYPGRPEPRTVTLHGGAYDACRLTVYALGQHLTVGGEHGRAVYEHKEHDTDTADYTAADEAHTVHEPPPPAAVPPEPATEALF